jgi:hypothetical protein
LRCSRARAVRAGKRMRRLHRPRGGAPVPSSATSFALSWPVAGWIAIAVLGGRMLIQAGILPQGLPTRLALLIGGTVACWVIIASGRR